METFLTKRTILIGSAVATVLYIAAWIVGATTIHCRTSPTSGSSQVGCTSPTGGTAWVVILVSIAFLLTIAVWVGGMVKTARNRHWVWFALIFFLPPLATLAYGLFGPEGLDRGKRPFYIEGTPRTPLTT